MNRREQKAATFASNYGGTSTGRIQSRTPNESAKPTHVCPPIKFCEVCNKRCLPNWQPPDRPICESCLVAEGKYTKELTDLRMALSQAKQDYRLWKLAACFFGVLSFLALLAHAFR